MYFGPQHPRLLEMQILARQQQFLREAARDQLLRQARAPHVRLPLPRSSPVPAALARVFRVCDLLRRALARVARGRPGPRCRPRAAYSARPGPGTVSFAPSAGSTPAAGS